MYISLVVLWDAFELEVLQTAGGMNSALMQNIPSRNRDYEREAVEFFEAKLRKFGPELQIKSLLGHRYVSVEYLFYLF